MRNCRVSSEIRIFCLLATSLANDIEVISCYFSRDTCYVSPSLQYLDTVIKSPLIGRPFFRQSVHCTSIAPRTLAAVVKYSHASIRLLQVQQRVAINRYQGQITQQRAMNRPATIFSRRVGGLAGGNIMLRPNGECFRLTWLNLSNLFLIPYLL